MKLLVVESASAVQDVVKLPVSVRREGRAMLEAVLEDARKLSPEIDVITLDAPLPGVRIEEMVQLEADGADYALIIAPEFDGILERLAWGVLSSNCQLLGPLPEAISLTADKWKMHQHWKHYGVPTPNTWLPANAPKDDAGRFIKKHRWGAGSLGLARWNPGEQVNDQELIQEFVFGDPVSLVFIIGPKETVTLLPSRQHLDDQFGYRGGSFLEDVELQERVIHIGKQAILGIAGLQGYVGVDAILGAAKNGSEDMAIEVNPRVTTSYLGLRKATKSNLVQLMLDVIQAKRQVPISWSPGPFSWNTGSST